jgi:hypothetical protein
MLPEAPGTPAHPANASSRTTAAPKTKDFFIFLSLPVEPAILNSGLCRLLLAPFYEGQIDMIARRGKVAATCVAGPSFFRTSSYSPAKFNRLLEERCPEIC